MLTRILLAGMVALAACSAAETQGDGAEAETINSVDGLADADGAAEAPAGSDGEAVAGNIVTPALPVRNDSPIGRTQAQLDGVEATVAETGRILDETERRLDESDRRADELDRMIEETERQQQRR